MIPVSYNVRSLLARKPTTAAAVLGIGMVVFVLASAMMLSEGLRRTFIDAGRDDNAIVMRKGSDNELSSIVDVENLSLVLAQPGIRVVNGSPLGVGEVVVVAAIKKNGTTGLSNVQIRGVPLDTVTKFRPDVRILEGRAAAPGSDEVMVGVRIAGRFEGLDLNKKFELRKNRPLTVVGIFDDGGSAFESEVWGDIDTIRSSFGRQGMVSAVRVQLDSPEAFEKFETAIEGDKRLGLEAQREKDFNAKQGADTASFINKLGILISVFCAIGAMIGAMITMYASIASRQREIGTMRALGFGRSTILGSFLLESILVALVGGALGSKAGQMKSENWISGTGRRP